VTAGAYAVPAFAQKPKLQAAQRADFLVHFGNFFCLKSQESTDECWLKFDGITLYQGPMRAGPAWTQFLQNGPTRAQALNKPVAIVWLLEEDGGLGDPDDRLGSHTIRQDEAGQGWKQCRFTLDGAHYGLDYHVERAGT
jgi:hypothetical protein